MSRFALALAASGALLVSGCVSTVVGTAAGAAVGVTGAAVGAAAKGTVAVGKAVIPGGHDDKQKEDER